MFDLVCCKHHLDGRAFEDVRARFGSVDLVPRALPGRLIDFFQWHPKESCPSKSFHIGKVELGGRHCLPVPGRDLGSRGIDPLMENPVGLPIITSNHRCRGVAPGNIYSRISSEWNLKERGGLSGQANC